MKKERERCFNYLYDGLQQKAIIYVALHLATLVFHTVMERAVDWWSEDKALIPILLVNSVWQPFLRL